MSNRLRNESSPYLLQHAGNPVDWFPWCEEAFEKAKNEEKPIFLSIGYSTCHWCHVMAHESFEDEKTAEILNQNFISIKVDREERPDIDSVYMAVCQALTGSGGWPMSIFMTWDKKPFFAGTYFPAKPRYGMPCFSDLIHAITDRWNGNRGELLQAANTIISRLKDGEPEHEAVGKEDLTERAVSMFTHSYDPVWGGFGAAPKFPTPHNLLFLMLYAKQKNDANVLKMAEKTLLQMRKGGIFDQIGYGFSRYSTDRCFLAPHFEKMLYDNALLIMAYVSAYCVNGENIYLDTAEKTAEYILREMTFREGGFYSAQDADSEGVEGRFYTFTLEEMLHVLGEGAGRKFAQAFDITGEGNFEGTNIPNLLKSNALTTDFTEERKRLYEYRKKRTRLHIDHKILLSWNALMIAAFVMLYRVSHDKIYLEAAEKSQHFIRKNMCNGLQLYTSYHAGKHSEKAFLDDYAFYTGALIELYHATLDSHYLAEAQSFCMEAYRRFYDRENGGFYLCERDRTELFMNPKETYDGAAPSGNSVMAYNFVRLYQLTDDESYREHAERQIKFMTTKAREFPVGHSFFLLAVRLYENPPEHITIVAKEGEELSELLDRLPFLANISVVSEGGEYRLLNGRTTYYVCRNGSCLPPENDYPLTPLAEVAQEVNP